TVFASAGLCLGFGAVLSDLTIAEELQEGVDHVDGRVVLESVPIRVDPMSTAVTVTGEVEQLRTMAFAWISAPCCPWRLSAELAQLPELAGTGLSTDVAPASSPRHGQTIGDPVDVRRDERSEEHTSELQSRFELVCRLLLEQKKELTHPHLQHEQPNHSHTLSTEYH